MEINLEKIELVKERTGATYGEAKSALENNEGSVVDAIIELEEKLNKEFDAIGGESLKDSPIFQKAKELVNKGNISRIVVRKDGKDYVNIPVTVGALGVIMVPWMIIFGVIAALGTDCEFLFIDENGAELNIEGKVVGIYDKTAEKISGKINGAAFSQIKDVANKAYGKGKSVWNELNKKGGAFDKVSKLAEKAADTAIKVADEVTHIIEK